MKLLEEKRDPCVTYAGSLVDSADEDKEDVDRADSPSPVNRAANEREASQPGPAHRCGELW